MEPAQLELFDEFNEVEYLKSQILLVEKKMNKLKRTFVNKNSNMQLLYIELYDKIHEIDSQLNHLIQSLSLPVKNPPQDFFLSCS